MSRLITFFNPLARLLYINCVLAFMWLLVVCVCSLAAPWVDLLSVIVTFPSHTHLLNSTIACAVMYTCNEVIFFSLTRISILTLFIFARKALSRISRYTYLSGRFTSCINCRFEKFVYENHTICHYILPHAIADLSEMFILQLDAVFSYLYKLQ